MSDWPTIEGKRLTQLDVHNLVVERDRARRDLRGEKVRDERVIAIAEHAGWVAGCPLSPNAAVEWLSQHMQEWRRVTGSPTPLCAQQAQSELDRANDKVAELEGELAKSRMDCINARLAFDEADGAHQSAERSVSHHIEERVRLEALLNQHGISPGPEIRVGKQS